VDAGHIPSDQADVLMRSPGHIVKLEEPPDEQ
jgi:hypothetical protein